MDFDTTVKLYIYDTIATTAITPISAQVATVLNGSIDEVKSAFQRLAEKRLLVLEPGTASAIRMAPPFSGIETDHVVNASDKFYYANCAWDAFGVSAALHCVADILSTCGDCGEKLQFQIRDGKPVDQDYFAHFAVPAAHWWDDIIYS